MFTGEWVTVMKVQGHERSKEERVSATIYWRPAERTCSTVTVLAPQRFIECMERAFGTPTRAWLLARSDVEKLKGMEAVWVTDDAFNPFTQLIQHIADYAVIEVEVSR